MRVTYLFASNLSLSGDRYLLRLTVSPVNSFLPDRQNLVSGVSPIGEVLAMSAIVALLYIESKADAKYQSFPPLPHSTD